MPRTKQKPTRKSDSQSVDPLLGAVGDQVLVEDSLRLRPAKRAKRGRALVANYHPEFARFLETSRFYLSISVYPEAEHINENLLGSFYVNLPKALSLDDQDLKDGRMYLYLEQWDLPSMVYYELKSETTGRHVEALLKSAKLGVTLNDELLLSLSFQKVFSLSVCLSELSAYQLEVKICLPNSSILPSNGPTRPSDLSINSANNLIQQVMETLHCFDVPPDTDSKEPSVHEIESVYNQVKEQQLNSLKTDINFKEPSTLIPRLREYQKQAVQWMISRENKTATEQEGDQIHQLFEDFWTEDGVHLYYNRYAGCFTDSISKPLKSAEPKGGILADEMGLGKTVEVLALILCNQMQSVINDDERDKRLYECPIVECDDFDDLIYTCVCGGFNQLLDEREMTLVKCYICGSFQHTQCINFDVDKWPNKRYYCAHCWVNINQPIKSRATLIISPQSICRQWVDEVEKHVNESSLKVLVYEGVSSKMGYIQPYDLADQGIVITTYDTLRSELNYVDLPQNSRLRHPKRFNPTPTPLLAVNWWRVCLDEAQMVEGTTSKTAEMALKLMAVNRWCVTGTPVQKSINDIYGLLLFIGEDPFHHKKWWNRLLFQPYCSGNSQPLVAALSQCFWRSSKKEVWEQIGIPVQNQVMQDLDFGQIENHFYVRQRDKCAEKFLEKVRRFTDLNVRLRDLDRKTSSALVEPLLKLRQACCHPQAVKGRFLPISKKAMSMEELLDTMIKNTTYECEEEHRKVISALNGQAAVHLIHNGLSDAVHVYRTALQSIEDHTEKFRTDKLQKLHTLHNLAETLERCGIRQKLDSDEEDDANDQLIHSDQGPVLNIGRTLRDENMRQEAEKLRSNYLTKALYQIKESQDSLSEALTSVAEILGHFHRKETDRWWAGAIELVSAKGEEASVNLVRRVKDTLTENALNVRKDNKNTDFHSIASKFRDLHGLKMVLQRSNQDMEKAREDVVEAVKGLSSTPSDQDINDSIDCHLRPRLDKNGKKMSQAQCSYCKIHEKFNSYEGKLYHQFSLNDNEETAADKDEALLGNLRRGAWGDSEAEKSLKVILSTFTRNVSGNEEVRHIQEEGNNYMKYMDSLKKEFRALRGVWTSIYDYVSLLDELNMATIRLRLRFPDEPQPDEPIPYILEPSEADPTRISLRSDEICARSMLTRKLSQLYYLKNLHKANYTFEDGVNPELCPICQVSLGTHWSVFHCGHCLCLKCLGLMMTRYTINNGSNSSLKCVLCRQSTKLADVMYVNSQVTSAANEIEVRGSWSTKVEAVVRCLLKINQDEPEAKALIFSTWSDVLSLISKALEENKINHLNLSQRSGPRFASTIDMFKKSDSVKALLLPIASGAKGLNLIEATHVFLVEPLLNAANEVQAVGRVHRIGQTKSTAVHRFIVKETIEEKIYEMFGSKQETLLEGEVPFSFQVTESSENAIITLKDIHDLFSTE